MDSGAQVQVACPAKLNWTLKVLGRRSDGFHQLDSWFVGIGLYDTLTLRTVADVSAGGLEVEGPEAEDVPADARNLVLQAEQAWRSAGGEAPAVQWHLDKRIPSAAGLGGGSSDAAGALWLLQRYGHGVAEARLAELALDLGSDVPFFLQSKAACRLGGRGEDVLAACDPPPGIVVLATPTFPVPTAAVFHRLDAPPFDPSAVEAPRPTEGGSGPVHARDASFPDTPGPNDLLAAAFRAVPELEAFAASLDAVGPFHLSGSGGTFFHVAEDVAQAEATAAALGLICRQVSVAPLLSGPLLTANSSEDSG